MIDDRGEVIFPVAEIFDSIMGEGAHAGTAMRFLRLAGCTVGKPYDTRTQQSVAFPVLAHERCSSWTGEHFMCDTDYRVKFRAYTAELLDLMDGPLNVCVTGGEPLMHKNIGSVIMAMLNRGQRVHIETSGTILMGGWARAPKCWVTVSPKHLYDVRTLNDAHAIKILVGSDFDERIFMHRFATYLDKIWLQPINAVDSFDTENMARCVGMVMRNPVLRLTNQYHKLWNLR